MKVKAVNDNTVFRPIIVELTFETREEFEAFYQVTNWSGTIQSAISTYEEALPIDRVFTDIFKKIREVR